MKKILSIIQLLGLLAIFQLVFILTTQKSKTNDLENELSIHPSQTDVYFTKNFQPIK